MATKPEPVPCPRCRAPVDLLQQEGGRGTGELTCYSVTCGCGLREEYFGSNSGRKDSAIREWNRWVKGQTNKLPSAA